MGDRHDGWAAERMAAFCEALAETPRERLADTFLRRAHARARVRLMNFVNFREAAGRAGRVDELRERLRRGFGISFQYGLAAVEIDAEAPVANPANEPVAGRAIHQMEPNPFADAGNQVATDHRTGSRYVEQLHGNSGPATFEDGTIGGRLDPLLRPLVENAPHAARDHVSGQTQLRCHNSPHRLDAANLR